MEFDSIAKPDYLVLTQVKLLSCVGMMYCGDDRLKSIAKSYHSDLVAFCVTDWAMSDSQILQNTSNSEQAGLDWRTWIQAETIRRTGYCIWVSFTIMTRNTISNIYHSSWIACGHSIFSCDLCCVWKMRIS